MTTQFARQLGRTTRHSAYVAALLTLLTAVSILGYTDPEFFDRLVRETASDPAPEAVSPPQKPAKKNAPKSRPAPKPPVAKRPAASRPPAGLQLTGYDIIFVVQSDHFFTPAGSDALRELASELKALPLVSKLFWLDDAPPINVFSLRQSAFPPSTATPRQFERARQAALENPLIRGQLLSADGRTLLMMIELDWLFVEGDDQCIGAIQNLGERIAAKYPEAGFSYLAAGRVPMILEVERSREANQSFFQYLGYGMVIVMAIVLFRGVRVALIVAAAPICGVYWTSGVLNFFEFGHNPFNEIVLPVLISMVGFTDAVHLMVETRRQQSTGLTPREAAGSALQKVGVACFLTSLTTAIGLGSLGWSNQQDVREFGLSCVIGVWFSFLAVTLLVPLACSLRLAGDLHRTHGTGVIDRSLGRVESLVVWSLAHSRIMSFVAIGLTIALVLVALQMPPDQRVASFLPPNSQAAASLKTLDEALNGMETAEVSIRWDTSAAEKSDEILRVISNAADALQAEPLIGHPVSIKSFLDVLPGDPQASDRMSMSQLLPPQLKRTFFDSDRRIATIRFRVRDVGIAAYSPVFTRIETALEGIAASAPGFQLELEGRPVRRWRALYQVVVDLAFSLASASVIIFIVLTIAYRSLRIGTISLVPNFFPLAFTGAVLYWTGGTLEIASVCAFTVCLGIAVDDTIHFLTRYLEEREHAPEEEAIRSAFTGTGVALIMTTVILVIGISTVVFSGMREQRIFATITCLTLGSALLGDLILLPPLLSYFRSRRRDLVNGANNDSKPTEGRHSTARVRPSDPIPTHKTTT